MRRARDFFGILPYAFASRCSLTASAKTVHRTVFFRRQSLLPPCSNPLQIKKEKAIPCGTAFSFLAESKGFFRHTAVCLRVAMLLDRVGENSPQDCFLPQAKPAPSLFESFANKKRKSHTLRYSFFIFGGEQGIRTLEQVIARYTISNRAPSASSDNSPYCFVIIHYYNINCKYKYFVL